MVSQDCGAVDICSVQKTVTQQKIKIDKKNGNANCIRVFDGGQGFRVNGPY